MDAILFCIEKEEVKAEGGKGPRSFDQWTGAHHRQGGWSIKIGEIGIDRLNWFTGSSPPAITAFGTRVRMTLTARMDGSPFRGYREDVHLLRTMRSGE